VVVLGLSVMVGGLTVAPHLYYQTQEASASLAAARLEASRWAGMSVTIERRLRNLLERGGEPGIYAESPEAAARELRTLDAMVTELERVAGARQARAATLSRLRLPGEYHAALLARAQADQASAALAVPVREVLAFLAAQFDTVQPDLAMEPDLDRLVARMRSLSGASLIAESQPLQQEGEPLRQALADALERARRYLAAKRIAPGLVAYLEVSAQALQDFDALVISARARDEDGVQRALAALREGARSLEAQDPVGATLEFVRSTIVPQAAAWFAATRHVQQQDEQVDALVRAQQLERVSRWSW
jgi:hypothetical protein